MKVRAIKIEPGEAAKEVTQDTKLEALQAAVDGYIEITYPFDDNVCIIGNEEAKLIGKKGTIRLNGSIFAGTLLIVALDDEFDFMDLTDAQVKRYLKMFDTPEEISAEEAAKDVGFTFISL